MSHGGFAGGFGGPGFGFGGFGGSGFGDVGGSNFGGLGAGPGGAGAEGFGPGSGRSLKRAAFGTAVILLDGPASAAQVVERVAEATGGAVTPPEDIAELGIGLLAGRGLVSVDDDVATLTELGRNILAWRGVTSATAHGFLERAARFADSFRLRKELFEVAGLARSIAFTGTDEQKAKLSEARTKVIDVLSEAKKELHRTLAES